MNARRTAHLRDAADRFLDLLGRDQHEVSQLVDHNDDLRHGFQLIVRRGPRLLVVGFEIADACVRHHAVAPHHLRHGPLQAARSLFRVCDDGDEQVRNAVVNAKLDHLRVDHDELDLLGLCLIEKGDNQRVHADRFAGAGRTGDQQMRQLADIADDAVAADVLADSEGHAGLALFKFRRIDDLARHDDRDDPVRYLDADNGDLVRDGRDADAGRAEGQRDIVGQIRDLGELHAALQLQLVPRDRRAARNIDDMRLDAEGLERVAQALGVLPHFLRAVVRLAASGLQERHGREFVFRLLRLLLADLLRDLGRFELHVRLFELFRLLRDLDRRQRLCGGSRLRRVKMVDHERRHLVRQLHGNNVRHGRRFLRRRFLCVRDQRVKLRSVIVMDRRLLRLLLGRRLRLLLRFGPGRFGGLLLPAAVFHKNVRAHRRVFSARGLLLRLLRHGGIVDRKVKVACAGGPALLRALHVLDVLVRNGIDEHLRRVLVLALRLGIFRAGPVPDGRHDACHRHVKTCDQAQQHPHDHDRSRADAADERFKEARNTACQNAARRAVDAAVPERGNDAPIPVRVKFSADQLHQTADQHGRQERAGHAQRDGPAVVQDQDQKAHDERERQDVKACADQPPEHRRHQIQKCRVHLEAAQDRQQRKQAADRRADLAPDGRRLLFCCFFPSAGGRGLSFVRRSHVTKTPHEIRDRISVNRPAPQQ